ncbi:hypothetical protein [Aquibacillus kalidii]|uniref:hypothetical protein n=1 Tax=Aquibacillus kalidii TaxID=2762597 RepID=UPI0016461CEC|nr:hypothetical protein [Aquibacillus kalidii]
MKLINELLDELIELENEYYNGFIDKVELNLRLQLIISKIDKLAINYHVEPLRKLVRRKHTKPFNQLLFKAKYHAVQSLIKLIQTKNKRTFQAILGLIISNNLYFNTLYKLLNNSCKAYIVRNQIVDPPDSIQVFIYQLETNT